LSPPESVREPRKSPIVSSEPRGGQKSEARYRHRYRTDLRRYVTETCWLARSSLILSEFLAEPGCPVDFGGSALSQSPKRLRSQCAFQVPSAAPARRAWDGKLVRGWLIRQADKMRALHASYPQPMFPPRRFHAALPRSLKKTTRFRIVLKRVGRCSRYGIGRAPLDIATAMLLDSPLVQFCNSLLEDFVPAEGFSRGGDPGIARFLPR
jgi:hypothetical protein